MPTTVTRDAAGNVWETKTRTTGKVEVRIRYCCCCSLRVAAILIAIYTIIMYIIFLALAANSLSRVVNGIPDPQTTNAPAYTLRPGENVVIIVEPYFDTLGWYTEEMKYNFSIRYPVLIINIVIFCLLILAAIALLVAVCTEIPWLVLPWLGLMCLDILRGTISVIMIFVLCGGEIRKIAVGIFFLGLQLFHTSLVLIMFAYFQWLLAKSRGQEFPSDQHDRKSVIVEGSNIYPTMPTTQYGYSNYGYNTSPPIKRETEYIPAGYATTGRQPPRLAIQDSPTRYTRDDSYIPRGAGYRQSYGRGG